MGAYRKIGVSVPKDLAKNLDYLSATFGVSRSQIVSSLLGDTLGDLVQMVSEAGPHPHPEYFRRAGLERLESVYSEQRDKLSRGADD